MYNPHVHTWRRADPSGGGAGGFAGIGGWRRRADRERGDRQRRRCAGEKERAKNPGPSYLSAFRHVRFVPRARAFLRPPTRRRGRPPRSIVVCTHRAALPPQCRFFVPRRTIRGEAVANASQPPPPPVRLYISVECSAVKTRRQCWRHGRKGAGGGRDRREAGRRWGGDFFPVYSPHRKTGWPVKGGGGGGGGAS